MKLKKNWKEIIKKKIKISDYMVIVDVDGDTNFCKQIFEVEKQWYKDCKILKLKIEKCDLCIAYVGTKSSSLYNEECKYNTVAYLTKEEFLNIIEEKSKNTSREV